MSPNRVLISGSVAYDTIMVFEGRFEDHILPDRVHMLNVSFLAPRLKREFGGCAANIAYTLRGLGGSPVVLAAVGRDGVEYVERLAALGIDTASVLRCDDLYTAQAFITTDLADNQITAFHPGAMGRAHEVAARGPAAWGIVAPNGKDAMVRHAREFAAAGIPWIFDPGQALPLFSGEELRALIEGASALAVNDYECGLVCEKTGLDEATLAARVDAMIVTRGGDGSLLHRGGRVETIAAAPAAGAVDPTGCGDAYRGGLLHALAQGLDWSVAARLGSVMGAIKIECPGPQNHRVDRDEVARRYRDAYGASPW
ncbi:MAG TPA: carbohydrate kinase family protein [Burkholderiaceae bacterium]|nr:carbohydrate kinase family protein [Burkholderiaceae bacterium]